MNKAEKLDRIVVMSSAGSLATSSHTQEDALEGIHRADMVHIAVVDMHCSCSVIPGDRCAKERSNYRGSRALDIRLHGKFGNLMIMSSAAPTRHC